MTSDISQPSQTSGGSRSAKRRREIRDSIAARETEAIRDWIAADRNPMRVLSSLLFDPDRLVQWRVIETLGLAAEHEATRDLERVRRQLRRFLWLMNDESGGLCWNAPEAIGEILFRVPKLIDEFGPILPSYFIEEPFERGSRWAVARVAALKPRLFAAAIPKLNTSLRHTDPVIRGYSVLALDAIGDRTACAEARPLQDDVAVVPVYDYADGEIKEKTVGELARGWIAP